MGGIRCRALIVFLMAAGEVHASGFQLREESAEGLGNANAGSTAKAYDVSTLFHNPAGMTRLEGNQSGASASWIAPVAKFNGGATVGGAAIAGTTGDNALKALAVGSAYAMWDAAPDVKFGLALTAPFGLRSEYKEDWVGRYIALASDLAVINLSPSVAYRLDRSWSVAGGLQIDWAKTLLTNAINFNALVPGSGDGQARLSGEDIGVGWTASVLYEMDEATRFGLSYRSSVRHAFRGNAEFQGVPGALAGNVNFADSAMDTTITLPDTVAFGFYHYISPRWAVMSDVMRTRWSAQRTLRVGFDSGRPDVVSQLNWKDTWFVSLGATYQATERLKLHMGTAHDTSLVSDQYRTARIPDSDRVWLSGGLSYAVAPGCQVSLSYAHVFGGSVPINETDPSGIGGRVTGTYDNHVDIVSAGVSFRF
ncbi:MAG: outer membrane protein transport protein [Rhodospirillaceae bacterium]|nr:outer membrane protein transport protein [Rhodospirillales bacterium]